MERGLFWGRFFFFLKNSTGSVLFVSKGEVFLCEKRKNGDNDGRQHFGRGWKESENINEQLDEDVVETDIDQIDGNVSPHLRVSS